MTAGRYLGYGIGGFGQCFVLIFANFILLFMTDTIGMDVGICGTLMMVSKIFDGISDVIFGNLLDRTHTRWGKAKPWILGSLLPLAIVQILLFFIPLRESFAQYAYFLIVYTLLNAVFYTANGVAYNSLPVMVTNNKIERVIMGVILSIAVLIGSVLVSSATLGLVKSFGSGVNGWRTVALIYSAALVICELLCGLSVKEVTFGEDTAQEKETSNQSLSFIASIRYLLHSKYYLLILLYYILYYFSNGVFGAVGTYYCIYILGNESIYGLLSAAAMIPMIIGVVFTPMLVKKWGMYKTDTLTLLLSTISCVFLVIGGYTGGLVILIIGLVLKSLFFGPMSGSVNAIIADISNYETLKSGVHLEGTMYSCVSMGQKLGGGIASAFAGWMMHMSHYDGMLSVQSQSAQNMISFLYIVVPSICAIIIYIIIRKIDVEKELQKHIIG